LPIAIGAGVIGAGVVIAVVATRSTSEPAKPVDTRPVDSRNPFFADPHFTSYPELQRHQVTVQEYMDYVVHLPKSERDAARPREDQKSIAEPVRWVTLQQATRYCATLEARLLTKMEWVRMVETVDTAGKTIPKWGFDLGEIRGLPGPMQEWALQGNASDAICGGDRDMSDYEKQNIATNPEKNCHSVPANAKPAFADEHVSFRCARDRVQ
jgi:hypothetical protein